MNLAPFTGPGSTPSRRRFWDQVTQAVIASQKVAGRHVSVDEHLGKGTVINVADNRRSAQPAGCPPEGAEITVTLSDVVIDCGCITAFATSFQIISAVVNGTYVLTGGPSEWSGAGGAIHFKNWAGNEDCSGDPTSEGTTDATVLLVCNSETGILRFIYATGAAGFFYSVDLATVLSRSNEFTSCGQAIVTDGIYGGTVFGAGHGGTVTISW